MIDLEELAESILKEKPLVSKKALNSDQDLFDLVSDLQMSGTELVVVFEELLINAREHGAPPILGYAGHRFGDFYFAIRDHGLGIHSTIPKNRFLSDTRHKSASALIRLSCEEGITGTGVLGRGVGLFLLSSYCVEHNAECLILSDGGYVLQVNDRFLEKTHPSIEGTLICLKVKKI